MPKPYSSDVKKLTIKALRFHEREATKGSSLATVRDPIERTSKMLGVPAPTLRRWRKGNGGTDEKLTRSTGRKRLLDDFDRDVIQRCIHSMYSERIYVTLRKLMTTLRERHSLDIKRTTLLNTIKALGFKYKRTESGKR